MNNKLKIFISYKREDQLFAEKLWQRLGDWSYGRWLDVKNVPSGVSRESSTWIDSIDQALKWCDVLIGVVTPESLKSENVKNEWFKAKLTNRRILLLRVQPFDLEDMPHLFIATDYIDFYEDEVTGFARLQRELENTAQDREAFRDEMTPPPPPSDKPPASPNLPLYLMDEPSQRGYTPFRLTFRLLGIITLPISFFWLLTEPAFEPLLAALGALASLLGSYVGDSPIDGDLGQSSKLADYEQMRKRIYQYWVQGVMQTALKEVEAVRIGLSMQPEAIVRDSHRNVGDIPLSNDSRHVRQVYDTFKSFLILGAPGAGKTIMLLQLTESLILSPPPTHQRAIPLVLNLSSWVLDPKPLHEWLEDETWRTYRVRGGRVRNWLKNNQLILLLDGLDEVKEENRITCVEAINTFRRDYDYVPLVVCSRIKDYEQLGNRQLQLPGAILLEDLSTEQVSRYLSVPDLAHLKRVVDDDLVLGEMAKTPFLLNTMIYAYCNEPEASIRGFNTEVERREHLFNTYVQRRLADNPSPYSYQQTIRYLQWLATKMLADVQTVFRLENIQPRWMEDDQTYQKAVVILRITYAVILTFLYTVVGWQMGEFLGALGWGILGASVASSIAYFEQFGIKSWNEISNKFKNYVWESDNRNLFITIILAPAIITVLIPALTGLVVEWLAVLIAGALVGEICVFFVQYERRKLSDFAFFSLIASGIGAWIASVVWSITNVLYLPIWIEAPLIALLVGFLLLHLLAFEEKSKEHVQVTSTTFQRVLLFGLMSLALLSILGVWLNLGAVLGVAAALTYSGLSNGITLFYKFVMWLRLRQRENLPLLPSRFLNAMTERQIMRQMGEGHIFIHRLLLEHFAERDESWLLVKVLRDPSRRDLAVERLVQIGDRAVEPLLDCLASPNLLDRFAAIYVLQEIGWKPDTDHYKAQFAVAFGEWEEAVALGDAAVEPLLRALNSYKLGAEAASALVKIGDTVVEPLIQVLKTDTDNDSLFRSSVVNILGIIGDMRAVEPLIQVLMEDDDSLVRSAVVRSLKLINTPEARTAIEAYRSQHPNDT